MILIGLVVALTAATAQTRPGTDSASSPNLSRLDSLYTARDTAGLVAALVLSPPTRAAPHVSIAVLLRDGRGNPAMR
jgi:hypothetical protein